MATRKTAPAQAAPKAGAKKPAAAVKTAAAKKAAPARKSVAAKKAAAPKAPARAKAAPKPGKPPKVVWKPQTFMASHLKDALFKTGLRSYAAYRELGVENATGGAVQAHVIRLLGKCDPKVVSIPHYHGVQFQFLYMLKGWMEGEYNGRRERFEAGACWIQPNSIPHTVLDYSDDCEMIELILPGTFETREL